MLYGVRLDSSWANDKFSVFIIFTTSDVALGYISRGKAPHILY